MKKSGGLFFHSIRFLNRETTTTPPNPAISQKSAARPKIAAPSMQKMSLLFLLFVADSAAVGAQGIDSCGRTLSKLQFGRLPTV